MIKNKHMNIIERLAPSPIVSVKNAKWEYKVIRSFMRDEDLDNLGAQGWELVSYSFISPNVQYIFKRIKA
jgi:hypothetical protein